jgi:hypothetical protein
LGNSRALPQLLTITRTQRRPANPNDAVPE